MPLIWLSGKRDFETHIERLTSLKEVVEPFVTNNPVECYCDNCMDLREFSVECNDNESWINIREMLRCSNCKLSTRQLLVFASVLEMVKKHCLRRIVIMERL